MISWGPNPEIFHIGGFAPRWYGALFAFGFYLAYRFVRWEFIREKLDVLEVDRLLIWMMVGTIVGARLGHTLLYEPNIYLRDPIRILKVWEGGLASHGALAGILFGIYMFRRKYKKLSYMQLLDRLCIPVPLAGGFIRIGNFFNSEIVGKPTHLPWAVRFTRIDFLPRHPTQIYEAICYWFIFYVLYRLYLKPGNKEKRGYLFGWMMTLVFTARFVLEFLKENQVPFEAHLPLNMGQLLSIPFVAVGIYMIMSAKLKLQLKPQARTR